MQERRYRPGDVLDDYCPRERRITDHAIVAMIDDEIRRTRCSICDAEHEYREAKLPTPRRKTQPPALFTQVLDGLQGPGARIQAAPPAEPAAEPPPIPEAAMPMDEPEPALLAAAPQPDSMATEAGVADDSPGREDGPVRRPLIRAVFPKREGQEPAPRALPEFTIQSLHNRNNRPGGGKNRRRRGAGGEVYTGPMRFGRDQGNGFGHGGGDPQGRPHGRRRRGGKKNR